MTIRIINSDAMLGLQSLASASVNCVVTSPPYWGLRDYGVPGQLGLEPSLGEHIDKMVAVFREVRRVLRKDGTLWLNYGDCYAASPNGRKAADIVDNDRTFRDKPFSTVAHRNRNGLAGFDVGYLKPKDLCGVPWRVALALQADGWWLRQDIIWSKPNPMPESVTDRCTKAHEYIFLLSKSGRYYFDIEAIKEPAISGDPRKPYAPGTVDDRGNGHDRGGGKIRPSVARGGFAGKYADLEGREAFRAVVDWRNKRSVWEIVADPYPDAHFATFPPELPEICIRAGCPVGGLVLDPFAGAGTTGLVADRLGRHAILIELNPKYADMAERRIKGDCPMFTEVANGEKA